MKQWALSCAGLKMTVCFTILCTYHCIAPLPPPLALKWDFTGGIDTEMSPHYGAFDSGF